jgi:hypothetical protein
VGNRGKQEGQERRESREAPLSPSSTLPSCLAQVRECHSPVGTTKYVSLVQFVLQGYSAWLVEKLVAHHQTVRKYAESFLIQKGLSVPQASGTSPQHLQRLVPEIAGNLISQAATTLTGSTALGFRTH